MNRLDLIGLGTVALSAAALLLQHQTKAWLSEQNAALRAEVEPGAPAGEVGRGEISQLRLPGMGESRELLRLRRDLREVGWIEADNARLHSNWVQQLKGGKQLTLEQIEPYLKARQRSAGSLLAAAQLTGDSSLLREAMEKAPADLRVALTACTSGQLTPEERRQWLDAFKQLAPDNALPFYLSAQACFIAGQTDEAIGELISASGKATLQDYSSELLSAMREGYQDAGLTATEAAALASQQSMPESNEIIGLGAWLAKLAQQYRQAGDPDSAQAAVQICLTLASQAAVLSPQQDLDGEFMGLGMEQRLLKTLDPASPFDDSGRSVRDRLAENAQRTAELASLCQQAGQALQTLSDPDLAAFYEQVRTAGQSAAYRWLLSQSQPDQSASPQSAPSP